MTFQRSAAAVLSALSEVIAREQPSVVFVLGDVVHSGRDPGLYLKFYRDMESLGVEIRIIHGNHDQRVHCEVVGKHKGQRVKVYREDLLLVISRNGTRAVALGHDLRNDLAVRTEDFVAKWFRLLREAFAEHIPKDGLLIVGHVHAWNKDDQGLSYSIPVFSADLGVFAYGVLERDAGGVLGLRLGER
jgi:calcineurin-like phosphoesterase family protein